MVEAAKIMRKHLNPFIQYFEVGETILDAGRAIPDIESDIELQKKLDMNIRDLELSVRATNCLESAKIDTVRKLVSKTEADLLKVRSFGKTSLREVKRKLADMGLSLGMEVPPPLEEQEEQEES